MQMTLCRTYGNDRQLPGLVSDLEEKLYAFRDKKYETDIENVMKTKPRPATTPAGKIKALRDLDRYRTRKKHMALLDLAKRARMMPVRGQVLNNDL